MRRRKAIIVGMMTAALLMGGAAFGLDALDKAYPPPLTASCCALLRHPMAAGG